MYMKNKTGNGKSVSIKEALLGGMPVEEIREDFEMALAEAQDQVKALKEKEEKEKAKSAEELKNARERLTLAIISYLYELGIISEEVVDEMCSEETLRKINAEIEAIEKEYMAELEWIKHCPGLLAGLFGGNEDENKSKKRAGMSSKGDTDVDDIIKRFIESL